MSYKKVCSFSPVCISSQCMILTCYFCTKIHSFLFFRNSFISFFQNSFIPFFKIHSFPFFKYFFYSNDFIPILFVYLFILLHSKTKFIIHLIWHTFSFLPYKYKFIFHRIGFSFLFCFLVPQTLSLFVCMFRILCPSICDLSS